MSEKEADTIFGKFGSELLIFQSYIYLVLFSDIVIPSLLILGLLTANGIIFAVIMHYRNKRNHRLDLESKELAEL
jgi:hypothetical protein